MFSIPPLPSLATPLRRARAAWRPLLAAALAGVVVACGGGTSQYDPFVPLRMFSFGDEMSALTSDGHNYGINGINLNGTTDTTADDFFDCSLASNFNWVQAMANYYGFVFAECNPNAVAEPQAHNLAVPGARVADVAAQVDAQVAAGGFRDKDVATLLVGVNDVIEQYGLYDGTNEAALVAEIRARGVRAGQIVNRLVALGAKVIVSNIPDVSGTPFAKQQNDANPGGDRAGLLSRLSAAFNEQMGMTLLLDGRYVALVQTDQRVLAMIRSPASYAMANVTDAACTTAPPLCTNNTLVTDANATTWLWSNDRWLSSRGQYEMAQLALARAQRNPF
jgi:phospholipase/lecithinase/hemolysin